MFSWSFKKDDEHYDSWTFNVSTPSTNFSMLFAGGAYREESKYKLSEIEGRWDRKSIELDFRNSALKISIYRDTDDGIDTIHINLDEEAFNEIKSYIQRIPTTHYGEHYNFLNHNSNNSNNNTDYNMLTEYTYTSALPEYILPANSENSILYNAIRPGNHMVDFHDEFSRGRYYKQSTYNEYIKPSMQNPFTRNRITPTNVRRYTAKFAGGKRVKRTQRKR